MIAMGRTFDATALAQLSPLLAPDPAEAARWYRRAADSGNKTANELLNRVESRPTR
jgi:TPR repeat protein